ncbi:MAG: hypothetical protein AAF636_18730 [Pseudomonadota bacterium]
MTDFAAKIRMASDALGCKSHKDLFARLSKACPEIDLTMDRAYKWAQGRATPRDMRVFDGIAELLQLDVDGYTVRHCTQSEFRTYLARRGADPRDVSAAERISGSYVLLSRSRYEAYSDQINFGHIAFVQSELGLCEAQYHERTMGTVQLYQGIVSARADAYFTLLDGAHTEGALALSASLPLPDTLVLNGFITAQPLPLTASSLVTSPVLMVRSQPGARIDHEGLGLIEGNADTVAQLLLDAGHEEPDVQRIAEGLVHLVMTEEGFGDLSRSDLFHRNIAGPLSGMTARGFLPNQITNRVVPKRTGTG